MKKILTIFICLIFLCSCGVNINTQSLQEIIEDAISEKDIASNNNFIGYKLYLPSGFTVSKESNFNLELLSNGDIYYLNVDAVSYHFKNNISTDHEMDDYTYFTFDDDKGYLRITKNEDDFFVELCYNYAIIEVEVKESKLRYAISRGMMILKSIKYNDLVIEDYINSNDIETTETVYEIPKPKTTKSDKNILEYIDPNDVGDNDGKDASEGREN